MMSGRDVHIHQIITNLLSNAIKFTEEGYIEVEVDAKQHTHGSIHIYVSVRDTGIGIDKDKIKVLFKPFNRIHNGSNEKPGTGLGLSISMFLCKNMGGSIKCESVVGKGTTFIAEMMILGNIGINTNEEIIVFDRENFMNIDIETVKQHITCKIKNESDILIVDDNAINRIVLLKMLHSLNANMVDQACDGNEALNMTRIKNYDLIFLDKFMPIMNGIDATRHIRNDFDCVSKKSPILFLSADTEDETIAECMNAGANGFLPKPYRMNMLVQKIIKVAPHIVIKNDNDSNIKN